VDDFRDVGDTAVTLLRPCGFDPRAAYDGPSSLTIAAAFHLHLCFLDLNMPGMGGDEVAVKLPEQAGIALRSYSSNSFAVAVGLSFTIAEDIRSG
jgi:CheY-like chemotaxis protein